MSEKGQKPPSRCAYLFVTKGLLYIMNNHHPQKSWILCKHENTRYSSRDGDHSSFYSIFMYVLISWVLLCVRSGRWCLAADVSFCWWGCFLSIPEPITTSVSAGASTLSPQDGTSGPMQNTTTGRTTHTHTHTHLSIISPRTLRILKVSVCLCV